MRILRSRLLEIERERQEQELSSTRRNQVKSGGRSDKIRTYNFKENRVTDHRIGLTLHSLDQVLAGSARRRSPTRSRPPNVRSSSPTAPHATDRAHLASTCASTRAQRLREAGVGRSRHRGALDGRARVGLRRRRAGDGRARGVAPRPRPRASTPCWNAASRASRCSTCSDGGSSSGSTSSSTGGCSCRARRPRWSRRPRSTRRCVSALRRGPNDPWRAHGSEPRRRRPRHRVGRARARARVRAARRRGVGDRRERRRAGGCSRQPGRCRWRRDACPPRSGLVVRALPAELRGRLRLVVTNPPYVAESRVGRRCRARSSTGSRATRW